VSREAQCLLIDHLARWEPLRQRAYGIYKGLMIDAMHVNEQGNLLMGLDIARCISLKLPEDQHFREARAMQVLLDQLAIVAKAEGNAHAA
jgi:hypothetical protein